MATIKTLNVSDFIQEFRNYGRDNFSTEALEYLFGYYDELENFEMDVIAICCDWTESDLDDVRNNYDLPYDQYND